MKQSNAQQIRYYFFFLYLTVMTCRNGANVKCFNMDLAYLFWLLLNVSTFFFLYKTAMIIPMLLCIACTPNFADKKKNSTNTHIHTEELSSQWNRIQVSNWLCHPNVKWTSLCARYSKHTMKAPWHFAIEQTQTYNCQMELDLILLLMMKIGDVTRTHHCHFPFCI